MLYQLMISAGLVIFAINLYLNLRALKRPLPGARLPAPAPMVSVLVPARNEGENIRACLESLSNQDYPNYEILVLDDNSSDNTSDIVEQIAAFDKRVHLYHGAPLAEGWAGKPFACQQLARKALGEWLLFVDADTTHTPQMLRSVMSLCLELKPSLLSGFPRQTGTALPQKIAIPVIYFMIFSWFPLWIVQYLKKPRPSMAIGQFLLFNTKDYWSIGGHQAVKSRILEDVWLGIEITRWGGRHIAIDLSQVVSCNMYRNVRVMREGFIRWMYSIATLSPVALIGLILAACLFYLVPFYWLWRGLVDSAYTTSWQSIIIFQLVIIYGMRCIVDNHFKEPLVSSIAHPLGFSFLCMCACQAVYRFFARIGISWKERTYNKNSIVQ